MSVVINTNNAAIMAANNLATSSAMLQKSLNRLSSGTRIVNPADDAGGLAVSMKLSAASARQGAVANNIGNAVSLLQTQDGTLNVTGKVLQRISELKTLYADVTKSSTDLANYDTEFVALAAQLTANAAETFNGVSLFGSGTAAGQAGFIGTVSVVESGSTSSAVSIAARDLSSTSTGVGVISTATSLSSVTVANITAAISNVATMRATNGSEQSRLGFANELITTNKANLEAATSRILDVDVASESTQLARWNILTQAGTSMLSQANQSAQSALKLLQ